MTFTVTFSNPQNNYAGSGGLSAVVPVAYWALRQELDSVSTLVVAIDTSVLSKYNVETAYTTNPVQLIGTATLKRDSDTWFHGEVVEKPLTRSFEGGNYLVVTIEGPEGSLNNTLCPDSAGGLRWLVETSRVQVAALPLQATADFGGFEGSTLWPDPDDATGADCYVQDADSPQDALDTGISDVEAVPFDVILSTDDAGFSARGWLKINNEWMYYDGYDDTAAGNKYRCHVRARAQLGTAAANHAPTDIVYNKIAKQIASGRFEMLNSGTPLRFNKDFVVLWSQGCFLLSAAASGTYTCTHSRYDDDSTLDAGSTQATLEDVVAALLGGPRASGGAAFSGGDLDFSAPLGITRYEYTPDDKPLYSLPAIQDAIAIIGLQDEVKFFRDHSAGTFKLALIANDTPALTLDHVEKMEMQISADSSHSGVLVIWEDDAPLNRAHSDRSWHVGADTVGAKPDYWVRTTANGESFDDGESTEDSDPAGSSFGMDMLHDGKPGTKLRAVFEHDPGAAFEFGHWWFGAGTTPPIIDLDYIEISFGAHRVIEGWGRSRENADFTYQVHLEGCTDYDTTTNTGTWQELGCEFVGKPTPGTQPPVKVEFDKFIVPAVNAIRVVMDYMPGPKEPGDHYWGTLHDIVIRGKATNYTLVQTSDTVQGESNFLYAPATHRKIRGGIGASTSAGTPKIYELRIGASSESAARTIGRAKLKTLLQLYRQVTVAYHGQLPTKPELGQTLALNWGDGGSPADYTGVLRGMDMRFDYRTGLDCEFRVLDSEPGLLT